MPVNTAWERFMTVSRKAMPGYKACCMRAGMDIPKKSVGILSKPYPSIATPLRPIFLSETSFLSVHIKPGWAI